MEIKDNGLRKDTASVRNGAERVRRSASAYFALQGIAVAVWWALLYVEPGMRRYFVLESNSETSLLAFWLSDLMFLSVGSLVASWLCFRGHEYMRLAAWFVAGAVSHATIYCLAFTLMTDAGWLGIVMMFPAMIWSGVFAVGLSFEKTMFREAAESSTGWILAKTLVQIVVVWSVILVVFPYLITIVEDKIGISRLQFPLQKPIAAIVFVAISSIGVWGAVVMSRVGKGTPLPLDHAKKLVILGPYAFVRNPMAVSGVGQGLAVAVLLGSPLVAAYALTGSLVWQLIFRPLEEDDLENRFGAEYVEYCKNVKCWIPRPNAYQIDGTADSSNSADSPLGRM
ncbi:MAG: isoprenylcysteine carboxylmethyltransferase family protein [Pyrinomonadaceae bacterium]|nr:isoprenylcysteine carboxylmethyltransferase family protein [Pyrinomonadaceae bacterium]MBP6213000.1 isoprenylcysteine carboxylmethyltransferase family protein [Pyrinomonadaceae bacterium]